MSKRMKVLIGYDGSPYADAALEDLRLAGLPLTGEAVVVTVGDVLFNPPPESRELIESAIELSRKQDDESRGRAHRMADDAAGRVKEYLPRWDVLPKALTGSASEELLREAQFLSADLIVVGSRGLNALGRFFLGSVSKVVATHAPCSVRIGRQAAGMTDGPRGPRIMVCVDGSAGAARAVRAVGMRRWPKGAEVRLISVDDGEGPKGIRDVRPDLEDLVAACSEAPPVDARLMVEAARMALAAQGLNVSVELLEGDPVEVLIEQARKWDADSLFVGARGLDSESEEPGLGSVSAKLVTGADCTVELVR
ncbi:MAG TPA: universal stress protein [Pyrinomonadaceae bacterium]|nr:universal stress protein [Pyrinomonadaceae bacterium]